MPGLTQDPLAPLVIPGGNADLPPTQFPTLTRISVIDLVGPNAANRQHKSLEKRSVSLGQLVNQLVTNNNVIDDNYLRRDGSAQKSNGAGILNDMPMNGKRLTGMAASVAGGQAVEHAQFLAAISPLAPINSPSFTGTPNTTHPPGNSDDARVPTTQWTRDLVEGLSFAFTSAIVDVQRGYAVRFNPGGTQTESLALQVERSSNELARYIEIGPPQGEIEGLDYFYPGAGARQFISGPSYYDGWYDATLGSVSPSEGPSYKWPILAASVRHDDNNPRTEAYFIVTRVLHDSLTDQILIRGVMKHFQSAGTSTFISRAQGVHDLVVPINNIEANLFTVSNQKGVANIYIKGHRTAPGQPAILTVRGERAYGGHGDNRTGYGLWFPFRAIASFPA